MSLLKNLKLTAAKPTPIASDAKANARAKLVRYLGEQKALVTAQLEGKLFQATKMVYRTNEAGERVRGEASRHVRRGWIDGANGVVFFQARYGSKPLEFSKGVNAVEASKLDELPGIIDTLIQVVQAGELDAQLAAAVAERKKNFRRKGGEKVA
ncbi:hypothetical protein [Skermanella stibiiresistens]|nr:hypothetical protein [Skermanella stibiiresistens]